MEPDVLAAVRIDLEFLEGAQLDGDDAAGVAALRARLARGDTPDEREAEVVRKLADADRAKFGPVWNVAYNRAHANFAELERIGRDLMPGSPSLQNIITQKHRLRAVRSIAALMKAANDSGAVLVDTARELGEK